MIDGYRSLWAAVVARMLADALSTTTEPETRRARFTARRMIKSRSRDFRLVCTYAGLNYEAVAERYEAGQVDMERMKLREDEKPAWKRKA